MPESAAIRYAFETFKASLGEGRLDSAGRFLFGQSILWGEELRRIYGEEDGTSLAGRDSLTRFFILLHRGLDQAPDLTSVPVPSLFLAALNAFPYLALMFEETELGALVGHDEDGNRLIQRLVASVPDGILLKVAERAGQVQFDLMPLYHAQARSLEAFIESQFEGDFDKFFKRFLAEEDIALDLDKANRAARAA